jgi:hypothetical protein
MLYLKKIIQFKCIILKYAIGDFVIPSFIYSDILDSEEDSIEIFLQQHQLVQ